MTTARALAIGDWQAFAYADTTNAENTSELELISLPEGSGSLMLYSQGGGTMSVRIPEEQPKTYLISSIAWDYIEQPKPGVYIYGVTEETHENMWFAITEIDGRNVLIVFIDDVAIYFE